MELSTINNGTARKVLAEFRKILRKSAQQGWLDLASYSNCREQGFAIKSYINHSNAVAFSEYRNSDAIVVYFGKRDEFEFNTNIPSEDVWQSRKFFAHNEQKKAAQFIAKWLNV